MDIRIEKVQKALGVDAGMAFIQDMPADEQLVLLRELQSQNGETATSSATSLPLPREEQPSKSEEEQMQEAIQRSLNPDEQENEDVRQLFVAIDQSSKEHGPGGAEHEVEGAAAAESTEERRYVDVAAESDTEEDPAMKEQMAKVLALSLKEQNASDTNENQLKKAVEDSKKTHAQERIVRRINEDNNVVEEVRFAKGNPRPICIDGNNVAWNHGNQKLFSGKGLHLAYKFFLDKGHTEIIIFCKNRIPFLGKHLLPSSF